MVAATTGLADVARGTVDPAWEHRVSVWIGDLTLLAVTAVVTLGLVVLLLRRLDLRRGRH